MRKGCTSFLKEERKYNVCKNPLATHITLSPARPPSVWKPNTVAGEALTTSQFMKKIQ